MNAPVISLLAALVSATPSAARTAIIALEVGPPAKLPERAALFDAIWRVADLRIGIDAARYDEIYLESAESVAKLAASCGSNTSCLNRALLGAGYALGLRLVINAELDPALLTLEIVDTARDRVLASDRAEVHASALLDAARASASRALDRAGFKIGARVFVTVVPEDAEIALDEGTRADPGRPNRFTIRPGRHSVRARKAGYAPTESVVETQEGAETMVMLRLSEQGKEASILESPWLWVGAAAVVAGGIALGAWAARPSPTCLCVPVRGGSCPPCM
jgi:hypothetical protein